MKTSSNQYFKVLIIIVSFLVLLNTLESCAQTTETTAVAKKRVIKIALLLDTSSSMDGLIDQAKSQLWNIVNELSKAKCDNTKPDIQIALYEYGNDRLNPETGFIKMVTPLTTDLDKISADLFSLTTNGGSEHCGQVIQTATNQLDWNDDGNDMQLIFIAGNEPFNQGPVNYALACSKAKSKNIVINTIFCGDFNEGINTQWKNGADFTGGSYMSINQNTKTVFIDSPYDDQISALNDSLNATYIGFGQMGREKKQMQNVQDKNAETYGKANKVSRAVTKVSSAYKNSNWDLVDAQKEGKVKVEEISQEQLPEEMKKMTNTEKDTYIKTKSAKREALSKEINELNNKRKTYVAEKAKAANINTANSLDNAMLQAVKKHAITKKFEFEK